MIGNEADAVRAEGDPSTARPAHEAWDPYDVWLQRVKRPRDLLPPPAPVTKRAAAAAAQHTHRIGRRRVDALS